MDSLRLVLLGMTIGATISCAFSVWRAPRPGVRWSGATFFLAVAAYAIVQAHMNPGSPPNSAPEGVLDWASDIVVSALSTGTVGWFWLFMLTLFEERQVRGWHLAVIAGLTVMGMGGVYASAEASPWIWLISNVTQAGLLVHALIVVLRGWKSDLVETRRRLRGPFLATVTIYTLLMRGLESWSIFNSRPEWFLVFNAATLALMCLAGAWVFLEPRPDLFGPAHPAPKPAPAAALDRAAKADIERLDALMKTQEVWREEGLTIASLAARVNIPEAQLRRLINDQLGYRNFPGFVNGHRIAAAKAKLSDPSESRTSISAIAFDLGFGSLGPFNRAFKEETGVSPSEWRRKSLGTPEPAEEIA